MAKILLVEDDNNLREIYEARLQAEGYEIVSARDGEEALTIAMKERPDLIISDVMMPKISGFDMLDIIRSTEETKNAKVIMMTALSQAEDKARAEKLGADRYLVKSQVTLEDVAKVAREVLSGTPATTTSPSPATTSDSPATTPVAVSSVDPVVSPVAPTPVAISVDTPVPAPTSLAPVVEPPSTDSPAMTSITPTAQNDSSVPAPISLPVTDTPVQVVEDEQSAIAKQIESFIDSKKVDSAPVVDTPLPNQPAVSVVPSSQPISPVPPVPVQPEPSSVNPLSSRRVIEPIIADSTTAPDLNELLKQEEEKEKMADVAKQIVEKSEAQTPPAVTTPPTTGVNMDGVIQQPPVTPPQNNVPADSPDNISL